MAIRFDASGDTFTRTTNLPSITAFTMMGWFKISTDRNDYSTLMTLGPSAASDDAGIWVSTNDDGTTLIIWNGNDITTGSALTVGAWNHIVLTSAGVGAGLVNVYLNGAVNISVAGVSGPVAQTMRIAANTFSGEWFNGCVAALKIYGAALGATDIVQEMRQYVPVRTANLNCWSPCLSIADDEIDFSGNGNNWTVGGTLATEDGPPIPWSFGDPDLLYIPAGGEPPPATFFSMCLLGTGL